MQVVALLIFPTNALTLQSNNHNPSYMVYRVSLDQYANNFKN